MPTKAPWLTFKCGNLAFARSQLARHVSANMSSQTASDIDSNEVGSTAPAFDTTASSPLNFSAAASTKRSGVAGSRRSPSRTRISEPCAGTLRRVVQLSRGSSARTSRWRNQACWQSGDRWHHRFLHLLQSQEHASRYSFLRLVLIGAAVVVNRAADNVTCSIT